jgi:hypothetical protein
MNKRRFYIQASLGLGLAFLLGRLSVQNGGGKFAKEGVELLQYTQTNQVDPAAVRDVSNGSYSPKNPLRKPTEVLPEENKKQAANVFAETIERINSEEAQIYLPLYEKLGISLEDAKQLTNRLAIIHNKSSVAQSSILGLSEEKKQYNDAIRRLLTPEAYSQYKQFENSRRTQKQFEELSSFSDANQIDLRQYSPLISKAIEDHNGIVAQTTFGPYDPNPNPSATGVDLLPRMISDIDRLSHAVTGISESLTGQAPREAIEQIEGYYRSRIDHLRFITNRIITRANMTPDERRQIDFEAVRQSLDRP